jgi:hypothetical protein
MRVAPKSSTRTLDERGVALPLALFGLVAVSILVTTALITSSTELALSNAHQAGTRGFYAADAALEQFVGERAFSLPDHERLVPGTYTRSQQGSGNFRLTVGQMAQGPMVQVDDIVSRTETYSILAGPANGRGRSVGAMMEIMRSTGMFAVDVTAGLTVGGSVTVAGNSTVSDGRNTTCEDPEKQAENALQVSAGSTISKDGAAATIEGKADTASYYKDEMVDLLLGGLTLQQAADQMATIRFAAGQFNGKPSSVSGQSPKPRTDRMNWGCPAESGLSCVTTAGNGPNLEYFPIVAIDGGGGEVGINGDHGQGILIIHNGSLRITGNFTYNGIILVEKDLYVMGTGGGQGVKLEGAVLALGENTDITDNVSGNAVITYNRCVIDRAQEAASEARLDNATQIFQTSTFAWFEVAR